jgi:CDP-diacylglycerol---serine O-phosphatidyltransferase
VTTHAVRTEFRHRVRSWKRHLPAWCTLGNGVCGVLAIIEVGIGLALQEGEDLHRAWHLHLAAWLVLAGMAFDGVDGFVARALGATSSYGAVLDSLCDLLSFGAAPAFIVFAIAWRPELLAERWPERLLLATSVAYAVGATVRLARFTSNTPADEASHRSFRGLPSPAAAGVVVGAVLVARLLPAEQVAPASGWFRCSLLAGTLAAAALMVSPVPYPHVINRTLKASSPLALVSVALTAGPLVALLGGAAVSFAFWGYALSGISVAAVRLLQGRHAAARKGHSREER